MVNSAKGRSLARHAIEEGREVLIVAAHANEHPFRIVQNLARQIEFMRDTPDCRSETYALHPPAYTNLDRVADSLVLGARMSTHEAVRRQRNLLPLVSGGSGKRQVSKMYAVHGRIMRPDTLAASRFWHAGGEAIGYCRPRVGRYLRGSRKLARKAPFCVQTFDN